MLKATDPASGEDLGQCSLVDCVAADGMSPAALEGRGECSSSGRCHTLSHTATWHTHAWSHHAAGMV